MRACTKGITVVERDRPSLVATIDRFGALFQSLPTCFHSNGLLVRSYLLTPDRRFQWDERSTNKIRPLPMRADSLEERVTNIAPDSFTELNFSLLSPDLAV